LRDLTVGPPTRLILLFSLPLMLGNLFQQVYIFVDSAIVGRLISLDALAAVGTTGRMSFLIIGFSWGATAGFAIPVSKAFGAGDMRQVRENIASSMFMSLLIAVVITVAGLLSGDALLRLINTPPELFELASQYQYVMFGTAAFTVLFNWLSAVIRALGDSKIPLLFLVVSNALNAALSYLMVGPWGWGVRGSALGTGVAQLLSVVLCLVYARHKMPEVFPNQEDLRAGWHSLMIPARVGLPMGFQMSVIGLGTVILGAAINGLGTDAVAASTVAARLEGLTIAPLNTFGVAMATFVAQNYGARQYARIRQGVMRMNIVAVAVAFVLGALQLVFYQQLIRLFTDNPTPIVTQYVFTHFQISLFLYFTLGILFVVRNTIQALGATAIPTVSGFVELGLRSAGALILAAPFGWVGVVWANPLAWVGAMIMCSLSYFACRKRLIKLERGEIMPDDLVESTEYEVPTHTASQPILTRAGTNQGRMPEVALA